ncbi:MAG: RluA family pseudouridine synthase [Candidatus Sericytochromatia bacterium]|nr:RluA family pseudouridine synthase [Candidatus Sericytochromatia bacterium]
MTTPDTPCHLITPAEAGQSLLRWLSGHLQMPHPRLRDWIRQGAVTVDGQPGKAGRHLQPGQRVCWQAPPLQPHAAQPQNLPLPIVYADRDLIVVNKPAGMASHPGPGWWQGSCVNALLGAFSDWPGIKGVAGPGIVHRLDRDTSGLLLFARSDTGQQGLLQALQARQIQRRYLAWVVGQPPAMADSLSWPLRRSPERPQQMEICPPGAQGLSARTHYRVLLQQTDKTLLQLQLESGRTHQIRVHLAALGCPVWGDPLYGLASQASEGLKLHAYSLVFAHPCHAEKLHFEVQPNWSGEFAVSQALEKTG